MLTFVGSLAGLVVALVVLVALVYGLLRFSPDERFDVGYFIGMLLMFGVGLGGVALMSLISPMAHDLIVIGICIGIALLWVLLYLGFGKKTLIVGLIAIIAICGYIGYSATLFATGRSPLARVTQATESSTSQVQVAPPPAVFQDNGSSMTSSPKRTEPEKTPPAASPQPSPQATQPLPAPAQSRTRPTSSPEPLTQPPAVRPQPREHTVTAPLPSPEPLALPTTRPRQEPETVASPPPVTDRQEALPSPSTAASPGVVAPTDQSPPPSPTSVAVPGGCYNKPNGSLDCLLDSQRQ